MTALLVVEDNATFAHTVLQFLSRFDDFTVAALATTAEEALEQLPRLAVDVALVDVSLPATSGIELVVDLRQKFPDVRCIMLSGHHEYGYVRRALDAANCDETAAQLAVLRQFVERRREALANLEVQLAAMPTAPAQHAESLP